MRKTSKEDRDIYKHKYDASTTIQIDVLKEPKPVGKSTREMFSRYLIFDPSKKIIKDEGYFAVALNKDQVNTLVKEMGEKLNSIKNNNEGRVETLPKF